MTCQCADYSQAGCWVHSGTDGDVTNSARLGVWYAGLPLASCESIFRCPLSRWVPAERAAFMAGRAFASGKVRVA